jgi:hypothetical protein
MGHGKAVQVVPTRPLLTAPVLKPLYDKLLSSLAFNFNLRHHNTGTPSYAAMVGLCMLTR